jgi:hypothetical protein
VRKIEIARAIDRAKIPEGGRLRARYRPGSALAR